MTRLSSAWTFLKEAVGGTRQDFTEGDISRAIALLAIPMVLEMSMESLFGFVDMLFVARLGADAVAAVALTESVLSLLYGVAIGLSMSTTAMVARRVGEKHYEEAAVAAVQAILIGLMVSGVVAVTGLLGAREILGAMGAEQGVIREGYKFTATMLGGCASIFLLFLLNAIFRGAGDASIAMRSLWLANAINIVLCPCLIYGAGPFPALGLQGSSVATTIGRSTGVAYQLWQLFSGRGRITIGFRQMAWNGPVMARLLRVSLTGIFQVLIGSASWIGLMRIMATFGSLALAGYMMAIRTIIITILPAWGMANAAATLVGQNLGAKKPDRAEASVWKAGFYNLCFLGGVGVMFLLFAGPIISLYTNDPGVAAYGVSCLRYIAGGYLFFGYGMVMVQAFNGAGDTVTPTLVNLVCFWLWQIPLAYALSKTAGMGPEGVYLAIAIAQSTTAVVGMILFRRGRWKTQKI